MINILICEDNKIIRQGLEKSLNGFNEISVIETFPSAESLQKFKQLESIDLILMDIGLPGMNGIECIKLLSKAYPHLLFLVLTIYEDNERIFEALCAGASGFLVKQTEAEKIAKAVQEIMEGGSPMSPTIARKVVHLFQNSSFIKKSAENVLSDREKEVLIALSEGNNYHSIGEKLFISANTVRFHIGNIYKKLHASTQTEAVAKAIKKGLI